MQEILDRLSAMATTLESVKRDLGTIEIPSKDRVSEVTRHIEELQKQFNESDDCLVKKQRAFLSILLELANKALVVSGFRYPSPRYQDRLTIGEYTLMYDCHDWRWYTDGRCKYLFGAGGRIAVFNAVCDTLIEKVLSFPGNLPADALQQATQALAKMQVELQPVFAK